MKQKEYEKCFGNFFLHKNKKLENHPSQPSTFINTVKA